MSCQGLKCAESLDPCVAGTRTRGDSKFFHELKCVPCLEPCVACEHTMDGSKFYQELKCDTSLGGEHRTGNLGRSRTRCTTSEKSQATFAVGI